jgi:DNA-binding NarL/FixJ family response regulator
MTWRSVCLTFLRRATAGVYRACANESNCSGLRRILRRKDGFVVVAECGDGDEVPDAVAEHRPDVVVMDLRMKRVDAIEATRRLSASGSPPVLALTTFNDDELLSGHCVPGRRDSCSRTRLPRS